MSDPRPVRLEVWGLTDRDRAAAVHHARSDHRLQGCHIATIEPAEVPASASSGNRGAAIASHARFGCTWTAFLLPETPAASAPESEAA